MLTETTSSGADKEKKAETQLKAEKNNTKETAEKKKETKNSNDKWKEMHLMSLDNDVSFFAFFSLGHYISLEKFPVRLPQQ